MNIAIVFAIAAMSVTADPQPQDTPASTAAAARPLGIRVGAKAGIAIPTSKLGAAFLGAIDAEYRLPWHEQLVGIGVELGYTSPSADGRIADAVGQIYDYNLDQRIFSVALEGVVRHAFGNIEPYAALGYSVLFLRAKTTSPDSETTESQTRSGLQVRAGAGVAAGPGHVFAEARYQFATLDFESTGDASGGTVSLTAGYRFAF